MRAPRTDANSPTHPVSASFAFCALRLPAQMHVLRTCTIMTLSRKAAMQAGMRAHIVDHAGDVAHVGIIIQHLLQLRLCLQHDLVVVPRLIVILHLVMKPSITTRRHPMRLANRMNRSSTALQLIQHAIKDGLIWVATPGWSSWSHGQALVRTKTTAIPTDSRCTCS